MERREGDGDGDSREEIMGRANGREEDGPSITGFVDGPWSREGGWIEGGQRNKHSGLTINKMPSALARVELQSLAWTQ